MEPRTSSNFFAKSPAVFWALVLLACAVLGFALIQQYAFGLAPCELCLWQRWPWGVLLAISLVAALARPRGLAERALLLLGSATLLVGAGIALFHVGVEQRWWTGLTSCTGTTGASSIEALRAQIFAAPVARCDETSWRLLGLSMAGYNFLISAAAGLAVSVLALRRRGDRA